MAIRYIQPVAPNSTEGLVARVYPQIKKEFGALVEAFTLHSPAPELLAGAWSACRESLLVGSVRREVKEAVAATVSRINQCPYCVDAHTIMLNAISARNSAEAIIDQRDDQIRDAAVRSMVEWAAATRSPGAKVLLSPPFSHKDTPEIIGRLILLTALAPYQVDEGVVKAFTTHITGDERLIGALWPGAVSRPYAESEHG